MTRTGTQIKSPEIPLQEKPLVAIESPFIRAPEGARTIFTVTLVVASTVLLSGLVFFGWRAAIVSLIAIASCVVFERLYFAARRTPALLGRSHAYLSGVLLALTMPPFVPWYVPLTAGLIAVIVGKAIFGGVGHFLWQPALVGRLAVTVLFPAQLICSMQYPDYGPVLASNWLVRGDVTSAKPIPQMADWKSEVVGMGHEAFLVPTPSSALKGLTNPPIDSQTGEISPPYGGLASIPDARVKGSILMMRLQSVSDLLIGARPGGIGETSVVIIIVGGLYLIYRNYVKAQLPLAIILSAAAVAALGPIYLQGPDGTTIFGWGPPGGWLNFAGWWNFDKWTPPPLLSEGLDVGVTYVVSQLLSFELILAAFFLAPEMTSRPVTGGGQVIFGIGVGAGAMLLKLYTNVPIPAYAAVLAMNTLTPTIDALWRPRVLGQKRLAFLRRF